jgi:hypothetical protein
VRELLSGGIAVAAAVAALFFLRFWRDQRDQLFAFFAAAFGLMAVNAVALGLTDPTTEFRVALYLLRLLAFLLILAAIVAKNRRT